MAPVNTDPPSWHLPVMADQVCNFWLSDPSGVYVDATFGDGGHTLALAQHLNTGARLIGLDRDLVALKRAKMRLAALDGIQFDTLHAPAARVADAIGGVGCEKVDGVLLDLGVSSRQLDDPQLGFSYRGDGPLDMRMDRTQSLTADEIVNEWPQERLDATIKELGEERHHRAIARTICESRPLSGTKMLKDLIVGLVRRGKPEPVLSRVFQALRIAVNDELGQLRDALEGAFTILAPRGRIVVLTYHSLEDRIVKQIFRRESTDCICPPEIPICRCAHLASVTRLTTKPLTADDAETLRNPRARSAKLRAVERKQEAK
jgi:16S rRNA (cytosine1402-N4)-methyltransferase